MLVAAVALATFANAAAVSWKVASAGDFKGGTVYGITGMSSSEVIALFQSTDSTMWSTAIAGAGSSTISSRGAGASMSENAGEKMVFAFITSAGIVEDANWAVSGDISTSGYVYTPPATKPGDLSFTYAAGSVTSGTFTTSAVPEPTSGLLLLLGMAGLALRRKQA